MNIQSPPSIYPPKRYCDLTGFEVSLLQFSSLFWACISVMEWLWIDGLADRPRIVALPRELS